MPEEKKIVQITCASCHKQFKMYMPANGGIVKVKCPHCKGDMKINFGEPKPPQQDNKDIEEQKQQEKDVADNQPKKPTKDISDMNDAGMQRGKLVEMRGFFRRNITYPLQIGDNIVGQYDIATPSAIMLKDNTVSRRSVNIKMTYDNGHIDYVLCVLRSTNPVTLNGTRVQEGEERYLKFGDTIVLGRTTLRFEKA